MTVKKADKVQEKKSKLLSAFRHEQIVRMRNLYNYACVLHKNGCNARDKNNGSEAIRCYTNSSKIFYRLKKYDCYINVIFDKILMLYKNGDFNGAEIVLEDVIKKGINEEKKITRYYLGKFHFNYGLIKAKLNKYNEASKSYFQAYRNLIDCKCLERDSDEKKDMIAETNLNLGDLYYKNINNGENIEIDYELVEKLYGKDNNEGDKLVRFIRLVYSDGLEKFIENKREEKIAYCIQQIVRNCKRLNPELINNMRRGIEILKGNNKYNEYVKYWNEKIDMLKD